MRKTALAVLCIGCTVHADELVRIEGSAFADFFDLAHAPGAVIEASSEGLLVSPDEEGTTGGALYSRLFAVDDGLTFLRAEWDHTGGGTLAVSLIAGTQEEGTTAAECQRFFDRNANEVDEARYRGLLRAFRGDTVTYDCIPLPSTQLELAESGEGGELSPPLQHLQIRLAIFSSTDEPVLLRSLVLHDDAGDTVVLSATWGEAKGARADEGPHSRP